MDEIIGFDCNGKPLYDGSAAWFLPSGQLLIVVLPEHPEKLRPGWIQTTEELPDGRIVCVRQRKVLRIEPQGQQADKQTEELTAS